MSHWLLGSTTFPPDFGHRDILNMKHQRLRFEIRSFYSQGLRRLEHSTIIPPNDISCGFSSIKLAKTTFPLKWRRQQKFIKSATKTSLNKNRVSLSPIQGAGFINKARARCSLTFLGIGAVWPNHQPSQLAKKTAKGCCVGRRFLFSVNFLFKNIII